MFLDRDLNYGRKQIKDYAYEALSNKKTAKVLDIGAGHGTDLINIRKAVAGKCHVKLYGVEGWKTNKDELKSQGIIVCDINIEKDRLPFPDGSMDFVCANQVLEHVKDIFWIFSEISRVLKKGGILVIGIPNLASLHNRLLLLAGRQPTFIKTLGPHVRGYTYQDLKNFIETDSYFKVLGMRGVNFYPFPPCMAKPLARIYPKLAAGMILKIRRTNKKGTFIEVLESRFFETNYYCGDGKTIFDKQ